MDVIDGWMDGLVRGYPRDFCEQEWKERWLASRMDGSERALTWAGKLAS